MNISRKHLIITLAIFLVLTATLITFFVLKQKTFTIAFYNTPESVQKTIIKATEDFFLAQSKIEGKKTSSINLKTLALSTEQPINKQLTGRNKPDLLICPAGYAANQAINLAQINKAGVSMEHLSQMPSFVADSASIKDKKVFALPLLIDHYELAINRGKDGNPQLLLAGGNPQILMAFVGAIAESQFGLEAAKELILDCQEHKAQDIPLIHEIAKILANAITQGYLPQQALNMNQEELIFYIEKSSPNHVFMPLSFHRLLPFEPLKKYDSYFLPSSKQTIRALTAPVYYGIPLSGKKKEISTLEGLFAQLTSIEGQGFLSQATGLAPTHASAPTPDVQADDVRYWVAATNLPLPALSDASFSTSSELATFASDFRNLVLEYVHSNSR